MQKQRGFTLIELIIVIVILGILAVAAAPRFINFGSDARLSTVQGLAGAMQGAADVVYGRAAIEGIETQEYDTGASAYPTTSAPVIEVLYGYPAASEDGIQAALNITATDWDIVVDGDPNDPAEIRFSPAGFNDPNAVFADIANCSVTYTESTAVDERPGIVIDDNC